MTDTETTSAEFLERFYAAIAAWDEDELLAVLHTDAEVHQPACLPYGGVYRGSSRSSSSGRRPCYRWSTRPRCTSTA